MIWTSQRKERWETVPINIYQQNGLEVSFREVFGVLRHRVNERVVTQDGKLVLQRRVT